MRKRKIGILGIEIRTPNINEMKKFYSIIFGTAPIESKDGVFFEDNGVSLIKTNNALILKEKNISLMFYTDDVSGIYKQLAENGFHVQIIPPKNQAAVNSLRIKDVDGNDVSLIEIK